MAVRKMSWATCLIVVCLFGALLLFTKADCLVLIPVTPSLAQEITPEEDAFIAPATAADRLSVTSIYTRFLPSVLNGYEPPFASVFGVQLGGPITEADIALSLLEGSRNHWARWYLSWSRIEPTNSLPADYLWGSYDLWLRNAYESNLELIVTVAGNPDWAAEYSNGPIYADKLAEFVEFVSALVERYDGDGYQDAPGSPEVRYWEFYNEPDAGIELNAEFGASYWGPFGDQYARMLCAVYPAMKAASPEAQIVLGGIAYDHFIDGQGNGAFVREFLGDVLAAGGGACFDVMNFHYYPPFEENWIAYGPGVSGKANYLRQNYNVGGKPMMVTEAGWHSETYSIYPSSPQIQARYVIQLFTQARYSNIEALTWWTWIDPGGGYGPNGLLTQTLSPKLAYYAFKDAARRLGTATPQAKLYPGDSKLEVYRFTSARQQALYIYWSRDGFNHTISLPLAKGQVVNMYGDVLYVVTDAADGRTDGWITVSAGADPLYVEAVP